MPLLLTCSICLQDREHIALPRKPSHQSSKKTATLHILKTLEFSSQTLRSGVVVQASDAPPNTAHLFIRGAPSVISDMVQQSSLPPDFDQVLLIAFLKFIPVIENEAQLLLPGAAKHAARQST